MNEDNLREASKRALVETLKEKAEHADVMRKGYPTESQMFQFYSGRIDAFKEVVKVLGE